MKNSLCMMRGTNWTLLLLLTLATTLNDANNLKYSRTQLDGIVEKGFGVDSIVKPLPLKMQRLPLHFLKPSTNAESNSDTTMTTESSTPSSSTASSSSTSIIDDSTTDPSVYTTHSVTSTEETITTADPSPSTTETQTTEEPQTSSEPVSSSTNPSTTNPSTTTTTTSTTTTTVTNTLHPISEKEKYTRTRTAFQDIQSNLNTFAGELENNKSRRVVQQQQPTFLQPASLLFSMLRGHRSSRQVNTEEKAPTDSIDSICPEQPTQECLYLEVNLSDIENLTMEFNEDPGAWITSQMLRLEGDAKTLNDSLNGDVPPDVDEESFKTLVDHMNEDLNEGIQHANDAIRGMEKEERDSIIFVSVFGTIGGLMVVVLLAATGCVIYKKKTGGAIKMKSLARKKKIKPSKMPGDNIPMESSYQEPHDTFDRSSAGDSYGRSSSAAAPPRHPPLQRTNYNKPTRDPYGRSAPRRDHGRDDIYSRPHAPRSDRYYTPQEVRSGGDHHSRRQQGGGLSRVY